MRYQNYALPDRREQSLRQNLTDLDLLWEELTCTLQLLEVGRVAHVVLSIASSAKLEFQAFGYIPESPAFVFNRN